MQCPYCCTPLTKVNDYTPPTCGKSECQEAGYRANVARTKPTRRLKPKEGAKKADGTRWTSQPGGIQKLEIPVPSPTSNEHMFARLLVEMVGHCRVDHALMAALGEGMGIEYQDVSELFDRAEAVVHRVKNHKR